MIIEIIGPAGAGKSTLAKALVEQIGHAKIETPPSYRKAENFFFFVRNSYSILPILSQFCLRKNGRYSLWHHFISLVMINGWHQVLNQKALTRESIIILDQGPVYMIAFERLFGYARYETSISKKYWERAFQRWAETVDRLIWLDTSAQVLVERIRKRETMHGIKSLNDKDACQYLESYRQTYESVISSLVACSNALKVLCIDTGRFSLEATVAKVINELHLEDGQDKLRKTNVTD